MDQWFFIGDGRFAIGDAQNREGPADGPADPAATGIAMALKGGVATGFALGSIGGASGSAVGGVVGAAVGLPPAARTPSRKMDSFMFGRPKSGILDQKVGKWWKNIEATCIS